MLHILHLLLFLPEGASSTTSSYQSPNIVLLLLSLDASIVYRELLPSSAFSAQHPFSTEPSHKATIELCSASFLSQLPASWLPHKTSKQQYIPGHYHLVSRPVIASPWGSMFHCFRGSLWPPCLLTRSHTCSMVQNQCSTIQVDIAARQPLSARVPLCMLLSAHLQECDSAPQKCRL